jgi:hypothetical protein
MRSRLGLPPRTHGAHPTRTHQRSTIGKIVLWLLLAMTIAPWLHALPAQAQAMRTFVSGLGQDSNPCTATAPCQTLQAALAKTLAEGQISALDSANYGYVNKAVSIISARRATGVLATSSVAGITITAGANDIINLQGLDIDGAGSGADGIQFNSGASLNVQNSVIRGFSNGINFQPNGSTALSVGTTTSGLLQLANSTVTGNGTGWVVANGGQVSSSTTNSIGGNTAGNTAPPVAPTSTSQPTPPPTLTLVTVDIASLPLGTVAANSLSPTCFTNPVDTVFANTYWTPARTQYLIASAIRQFIVQSQPACNTRDVELTTWARQGYAYVRLDSTGKAIYFFHNGETTNGYLEIGIVTGLDATAYPGGTYYPLYENNNLVGTVSGYNRTNTTGASFTFGVSGFDIYVRFNGVEFVRFKEYRQMNVGAVALKANTGYGFRAITMSPLANRYLYSDYANNKLDMRDWGMRSIQTTGTIAAGSSTLVLAAPQNLKVGDFLLVEIGHEAGAGLRGTIGVGGVWPALYYPTTAALQADMGQPANTFAWAQGTGEVWRFVSGTWVQSPPFSSKYYYPSKAIPMSLQARITAIAGDNVTITLDTAATVAATNANVYLDNQLYLNDLLQPVRAMLGPIMPSALHIIIPSGSYALGGTLYGLSHSGWTIEGQGQGVTILFSAKGLRGAGIMVQNFSGLTIKHMTISGNYGLNRFGLNFFTTMTPIPSSSQTTQYDASGLIIPVKTVGAVTQTALDAAWFPSGINIRLSDDAVVQDVTVNDVFTNAVQFIQTTNGWANRVTVNVNSLQQSYTQWQLEWANATNGGCQDCTINGVGITHGFESFASTGTKFIRPTANNALFAFNNAGSWLLQDGTQTITPNSIAPAISINNPLVAINANTGSDLVGPGGTISNLNMTVQGYIDANNDVPVGIIISSLIPNITITGGSYTAPNYTSPSTLVGPQGIRSQGTNIQVSGFTSCGTLSRGRNTWAHANIGISKGSVINSTATVIAAPTQSGNSRCP